MNRKISRHTLKAIEFVFGVPVEKSAYLHNFPPFRIALYIFLGLNSYYIFKECLPIESTSLKNAYIAFTKHEFITSSSKYFAASIAIIIAWQRSIISDLQLKMQSNTNKISNYFSIQNHISKHIEENYNNISPDNLTLTNKTLFFNMIFNNPSDGKFSPSSNFIEFSRQLNIELDLLISNCARLNKLSDKQHGNYYHTDKISTLPESFFEYFLHNRKLNDNKKTSEFESILEEINNSERSITYAIRNYLNLVGFDLNNDLYTRLFRNTAQSIFISSLINYIQEAVLHLPIPQSDKLLFEKELSPLTESLEYLNSITFEWIMDMSLT